MPIPEVKEKWTRVINTIAIGATPEEGGTRSKVVKIGGSSGLPFLSFEGETLNAPAIAMDVYDMPQEDWPESLAVHYKDVVNDPGAWANKCKEFGADLICLRLQAIHPDFGNKGPEHAASITKKILEACDLPLMVLGCEVPEVDNICLPAVADAAKGENILLGYATEKNYATLAATCNANQHKLAGLSPIDINIAKQINILIGEAGFPVENTVIYPSTGALGYGIEYCYSIMERGRSAALAGDKLLAQPVMCDVGMEAWKVKEAKAPIEDFPAWGPQPERGVMWEALTATTLLQAGADLLLMNHPEAVKIVKKTIEKLMNRK